MVDLKTIKNTPISGITVNLAPCSVVYLPAIVEMRNSEQVKFGMNVSKDLILSEQEQWFDEYQKRDNDFYFIVLNKVGRIIGTNAVYHIDLLTKTAELGRTITNPALQLISTYAMESTLRLIDLSFDVLQLSDLHVKVRYNNFSVLKLVKKIGFEVQGESYINGVLYIDLIILPAWRDFERFYNICQRWESRIEKPLA